MPAPYHRPLSPNRQIRGLLAEIRAEWLAGLSWIYPEICQVCFSRRASSEAGFVCAPCQVTAAWIPQYASSNSPLRLPAGTRSASVRSALWNRGAPKVALKAYKYNGARCFEPYFDRLIGEWLELCDLNDNWDGIIPVPISSRREIRRGFNQSKEIARSISARLSIPLKDRVLRRTHTRPQAGLSRSERASNLNNAFFLRPRSEPIRGAAFLIFDDVFTTGATIEACAEALIRGGAERVAGLTLLKER